jgi:2-polyprenyl-6-methoxyphenol hydroxylase-like FAD-dependent oxidoreductase
MGASQALIGARVLARQLAEAGGDHRAGFVAYERELRPYVMKNQATGREGAKMFGARTTSGEPGLL